MTNNGRILKSHQLANHEIVLLGRPGEGASPQTRTSSGVSETPVEDALLFTASEVEDLCEKARASGAADAAASLEPALGRVALALEEFSHDAAAATHETNREHSHAIIDSAMHVARWVVGRELSDPAAVLDLVAHALDEPISAIRCKLSVHAELVPLLYDLAPDSVEVVADYALEIGEFRVERDGPEVALRLDTALERARTALSKAEPT